MGGRVPDGMRAQLKRIMTSEASVPVMMYYLEYVLYKSLSMYIVIDKMPDISTPGGLETIPQPLTISTATSTTPCTRISTEVHINLRF
jgi:hypothetical protein